MSSVRTIDRVEQLRSLRTLVQSADLRKDEEFQSVFREARVVLEMSDQEIGDALSVSRPTVNRWVNGKNLPYYAMRKAVTSWIGDQLTKKIKRIESSVRQSMTSYSTGSGYSSQKLVAKSL